MLDLLHNMVVEWMMIGINGEYFNTWFSTMVVMVALWLFNGNLVVDDWMMVTMAENDWLTWLINGATASCLGPLVQKELGQLVGSLRVLQNEHLGMQKEWLSDGDDGWWLINGQP